MQIPLSLQDTSREPTSLDIQGCPECGHDLTLAPTPTPPQPYILPKVNPHSAPLPLVHTQRQCPLFQEVFHDSPAHTDPLLKLLYSTNSALDIFHLAATVPFSQALQGQGPSILTSCLLKFWTHCSNCSSFVSSAFPSFWRTFQGRGRREECYTEKESGQTKSSRSPIPQSPLHPSGVLRGPWPGSPSPGHWDHQRACGCCDPQGQD